MLTIADQFGAFLPLKNNAVFLAFFANPDNRESVLLPFLRHVYRLPDLTIDNVEIIDPMQRSEYVGEKHPIVDISVSTPSGAVHNEEIPSEFPGSAPAIALRAGIEMQYRRYSHMRERLLYYHCRVFGKQLVEGQRYDKLKRTISLLITHKTILTEEERYFNRYFYINKDSGGVFSDISEINVLELEKLPETTDGSPSWIWGKLINAEEEEEFAALAEAYPEIRPAVGALKKLSADQKLRIVADAIEMARMDDIAFLEDAELRGHEEGFRKGEQAGVQIGIEKGMQQGMQQGMLNMARNAAMVMANEHEPVEKILRYTGLTITEYEQLLACRD